MKKNIKAPSLVTIATLTVITVVFWIVFSVLRLLEAPTEVRVSREALQALAPALDTETLQNLPNRLYFAPSQIGETTITFPQLQGGEQAEEETTEEEGVETSDEESASITEEGETSETEGALNQ